MGKKRKTIRQQIGFIGFGEVGSTFANALAGSEEPIFVHDALQAKEGGEEFLRRKIKTTGIFLCELDKILTEADIVFSCVPPKQALPIALSVATKLKTTAIYIDVNSVSGPTITQISEAIESGGTRFVDAAMMGPVPLLKLEVPIVLSGKAAEDFHQYAKVHGFNTKVISSRAGDASSLKMLWSVMTKGTIALYAESLIAGYRLGLHEPLREMIAKEYGRTGSDAMVLRMLRSTAQSGARRVDEMEEVKKTLEAASVPSWTVEATLRWMQRLSEMETARSGHSIEDVLQAMAAEDLQF